MCGICGVYIFSRANSIDKSVLGKMCKVIAHRGPDDEGFFVDDYLGMGVKRLSIIDLETGHQPIHNEDESLWVVFNGEIYNFRSLRKELEAAGHQFYTSTDTEVIVHAYEEFGEGCVHRFNGMFAFALWDANRKKLFLARDRFGIKPLHYTVIDGQLLFASEIKSILENPQVKRELNLRALHDFLSFEWVPAPETMFRGINKLLPGHFLTCEGGLINVKQYWDLEFSESKMSEDYAVKKIIELLRNSVEMRLVSDVPLGAFLSGGIDSSTVVGLMSRIVEQPVKTFSIGFEDQSYSEIKYARIVAEHFETDHYEEIIRPDVLDLLTNVIKKLDEPFADVSSIPTYLVSEAARRRVKVCLSGDGGDELFAGYDQYVASKIERYYRRLPRFLRRQLIPSLVLRIPPSSTKKGIINKSRRFVGGALLPSRGGHMRWMTYFSEEEKRKLYSDEVNRVLVHADSYDTIQPYFDRNSGINQLSREQYVDIKLYLQDDILVKVDRMSMANSLEVRVPFLDHNLAEFVATMPPRLRLNLFKRKYILRKVASAFLPKEIVNRDKQGFSIPMKNWLRNELRGFLRHILSESGVKDIGYFEYNYVDKLIKQHLNGSHDHWHKLWALICFQLWHKIYVDGVTDPTKLF